MRSALLVAAVMSLVMAATVAADPVSKDAARGEMAAEQPYMLPNTQVLSLRSEETGADYQLFIATPPKYRASRKTYPVVFMLDADYSFAITRNIVQHFVERKQLPEMFLVGIAYPGASENLKVYKRNRTRDYTPSLSGLRYGSTEPDRDAQRGGAVRFRNFIANEVIPFMATQFPINGDRTFIGHSYGGLFGAYVLLTEPELFKRYVIVSPSLWYGNRMIFRVEQQTAAARAVDRKIPRHAFFAIGAAETQAETGAPMVQELRQFVGKLQNRSDPGLIVDMRVYPEDTHSSVFPGAVTRGLLSVFPPSQS